MSMKRVERKKSEHMTYNTATVRKLLNDAFGDEGLDIFCYDHFNAVYEQFTTGQTKGARIQLLISFVRQHGLFDSLLHEVQKANSNKYAEFKSQLKAESESEKHQKILLSRLPTTGSDLFGREKELTILDNAWADPHTHILTLVAWGGVGKTSLVNHWLNRIEPDNYRGADKLYGWSFYSQGTSEDRQASADEFIAHALTWFGDPDSTHGSPWDRGVRLAELVRRQRTLLLLDGMEPLQYPPGQMKGRLKDQGLQALLKELSRFNEGLCIITTRLTVAELEHAVNFTVKNILLEHLSPEAGAKLLEKLGVKGAFDELKQASQEFKGHALALNLLGSYLAVVYDGDIRKRDLIPQLTEEEKHGGHARRVTKSYEKWLSGTSELNILYLMGLFDRPAAGGAIEVLKAEPAIEGLTTELQYLSPVKWKYALKRLRNLCLIAEKDKNRPDALDCHPLVREHFGEKLKRKNPIAWKEAHSRLYEYYKNIPNKHLPDTLEEMGPLFAAVTHGCQANRYQEALDVYNERIRRNDEDYNIKKLGAYGAELTALAAFFETPWDKLVGGFADESKSHVLYWAGICLQATGRLQEAIRPSQDSYEADIRQKNWEGAVWDSLLLSELYLSLGDIKQSIYYARRGVKLSERTDAFRQHFSHCILADALHKAGELLEAECQFQKADTIGKDSMLKEDSDSLYRYALWGFRFSDFLLVQGQCQEVQERAEQILDWIKCSTKATLIDIALTYLSLGCAHYLQIKEKRIGDFTLARDNLNNAVEYLRKSGRQDVLPFGVLARAALFRMMQEFHKAWVDLEEAQEIAERGGMKLYLADYHLEACRLLIDQLSAKNYKILANGEPVTITRKEMLSKLKDHFETAKQMVNEMGYHRRDKELESLDHELNRIKESLY